MTVCGVDLGSRRVKLVIRREDGRCERKRFDTAEFYRRFILPGEGGGELRRDLFDLDGKAAVFATGYGRARLGGGAKVVPEMEAIVDGVLVELGLREAVILDVGGQDAKALYVREGRLQDFAVNDRCAASSGRFLENMARVLGISLEELGRYWENPVRLSSTCAVFGETELIGLMGEGCPMESLAAGVNWAVAGRLLPLLARFPPLRLVLTGGGAYNAALCRILAEKTGREALVPRHPDFVAAEGCCRRAMEDRST